MIYTDNINAYLAEHLGYIAHLIDLMVAGPPGDVTVKALREGEAA